MAGKPEPSAFFLSFVGEFVQIITNVQFNSSGRKSSADAIIPLVLEGYVLDADAEYVYLSPDGVDIKQAVKNNVIVCVQVTDGTNEADELLDSLPHNMKKRDMN